MSAPDPRPTLAAVLARLEAELDLPPELHAAVAEALLWAYSLEARAR